MSKSRVDVLLTSVSEVEMSELRCVMDDKKKNYERIDMRPPQQSGWQGWWSPHTVHVFTVWKRLSLTPAYLTGGEDSSDGPPDKSGPGGLEKGGRVASTDRFLSFLLLEREKLHQVSAANGNEGIKTHTHTHTEREREREREIHNPLTLKLIIGL